MGSPVGRQLSCSNFGRVIGAWLLYPLTSGWTDLRDAREETLRHYWACQLRKRNTASTERATADWQLPECSGAGTQGLSGVKGHAVLPCRTEASKMSQLAGESWGPCRPTPSKYFFLPFILVFHHCCNKWPQTGALKYHPLILSWFWRPEVQNQGHWQPSRCQEGCAPSRGCRGTIWPLPLSASGGCQPSLACGCSISISASLVALPSLLCVSNRPLPPSYKDTCVCIDNLPMSRSLINHIYRVLPPPFCHTRTWIFWGGTIS